MKAFFHGRARHRRLSGMACVLMALAGCGDKNHQAAAPAADTAGAGAKVATLGETSVSSQDVEQILRALPAAQRLELASNRGTLDRIVRSLLAERALVAQAHNQGWPDRPEVQRALKAAQDQVILRTYLDSVSAPPANYPSEAELQAAYDQNKAQFAEPATYRLNRIYLAASSDPGTMAEVRKRADDILKRARAPKADFAQLVKEVSQGREGAASGGDTGFVPLQQIVPELRKVVQQLRKGDISDVVQLSNGLYIVKLVDVREARIAPLPEVQVQLREALRAQRQKQAAQAYLDGLVNAGTISIDGKALQTALDAVNK